MFSCLVLWLVLFDFELLCLRLVVGWVAVRCLGFVVECVCFVSCLFFVS